MGLPFLFILNADAMVCECVPIRAHFVFVQRPSVHFLLGTESNRRDTSVRHALTGVVVIRILVIEIFVCQSYIGFDLDVSVLFE